MILSPLSQADRYAGLHPRFAAAFAFLRQEGLAALPPGRYEIDGSQLFALITNGPGRSREVGKLESHRAYIDIQYVAAGIDKMGWKSTPTCTRPQSAFDTAKDAVLYDDTPDAFVATGPGSFTIFFPEDAHTPLLSPGNLHKVVVKIAIA
ncbi:MAG: YhcH/YjgK/YiaL family protein [Chloroflexi bacterium]|nr:YhcH/YjgK/YiaL family protein [Chloroflexota bacterium]